MTQDLKETNLSATQVRYPRISALVLYICTVTRCVHVWSSLAAGKGISAELMSKVHLHENFP